MKLRHRGFTLLELLVTVGILTVVMALLAFPIFSAYGYIRQAQANTDAKLAADIALQRVKKEVALAGYIFDIPADGSMLTFVPSNSDGELLGKNGEAKLVRYQQMPDFPWMADGPPWTLLRPNYTGQNPSYASYYTPFWYANANKKRINPYILARYEKAGLAWNGGIDSAVQIGLDGSYPLQDEPVNMPLEALQRKFRNNFIAVTPLGAKWDVPQFQATPLRINTETLAMLSDSRGQKKPIAVLARYPMWAGRNMDVDALALRGAAGVNAVRAMFRLSGTWPDVYNDAYYSDIPNSLLRLYPALPAGPRAPGEPDTMNPFGFQIRVFDNDSASANFGKLVYGIPSGGNTILYQRHFMDWPPIDRPDWDASNPLWTKADVERQRLEGKVVFAQPMVTTSLSLSEPEGGIAAATLPIPTGASTGWADEKTYLVDLPRTITLTRGGTTITFRRVTQEIDLEEGAFYVLPFGASFSRESREITFCSAQLVAGTWTVPNGGRLQYTICDLQPTDVVVATYSTKGVLDMLLTVSRQDSTRGTPRLRRQDHTARFRVSAENAIMRARSSR